MTVLLEAKNLHITFGAVKAANGVNLHIDEGEFLAIIGPNGSGKTTFLNLCTGYIRPSEGEVTLDGKPITRLPPRTIARKGIARAFQIPLMNGSEALKDCDAMVDPSLKYAAGKPACANDAPKEE